MDKSVDKSARMRWAVLLSVAAITAIASFYPTNELTVSQKTRYRAPKPVSTTPITTATLPMADVPESEALDPFAPRGWQPPPPPEPVKAPTVAQAPVAPPPPAGPPPLPFKFMGRLDDGADGAQQLIYLSKGEQTYIPQVGETLDSTYKVVSINAERIEFEHLPTGEKQTLPIPAPDK
ncbi:MAG TPA: hypothetical protein VIF60_03165 [Burkholderiaceae bacterium]